MSQLKIKNGNNWESIPAGGIGVPSGGNAGDVLVKSSSADYATEWASKGMTLLWTNPNTSADFGEQTVSIDLSGYICVVVTALFSKNDKWVCATALMPTSSVSFRLATTDNVNIPLSRNGTASSTGVFFGTGYYQGTRNDLCIPYQIWGVK